MRFEDAVRNSLEKGLVEIDEGKKMPTIPSRRTMLKEGPSRLRRSDRQTLV